MPEKAQLFFEDGYQVVRLPMEFRFDGSEIYIRRDLHTGDVILSRRPDSWADFIAEDASTVVPADFMTEADRQQGRHVRDPFCDF